MLSPFSHELPTQTQLPHAVLKENKLKDKEMTENPIFFFSEKGYCCFIFSFSAVDSDLSGKKPSISGDLKR